MNKTTKRRVTLAAIGLGCIAVVCYGKAACSYGEGFGIGEVYRIATKSNEQALSYTGSMTTGKWWTDKFFNSGFKDGIYYADKKLS